MWSTCLHGDRDGRSISRHERRVSYRKGQVTIRRQPPSGIDDEQGHDDDWLAEQGELDWFHDPRGDEEALERQQAERTTPRGLVRSPGVRAGASPGTVERRRRIFLLAALALAVVVVIVIVVATSGGGGGSPSTPATTPQTTQPTTSPETTTTTPTTTTTTTTTPSLQITVPAGGNLSAGDSGSAVLTLQKALTALGFYDGALDGDFGSGTQAAVIAFQEAHNLKPDGIVGTDTARALNQALAAAGR